MIDKKLRALVFGAATKYENFTGKDRSQTWHLPSLGEEPYRSYTWGRDDGFVVVLIRMIEKLERRIAELENKNLKTKK